MSRVLPILFDTEMVRAILDGRKTVTRRLIKPQPKSRLCYTFAVCNCGTWSYPSDTAHEFWGEEYKLPYCITDEDKKMVWKPPYHADDVLYVRETWSELSFGYAYKADGENIDHLGNVIRWHPSIHMPKEAARIWLKVKDVRVERLQDITEEQAKAEGIREYSKDGKLWKYAVTDDWWISYHHKYRKFFVGSWWQDMPRTAKEAFHHLWNSTLGRRDTPEWYANNWSGNPWVWVIEFERCEKPEGLCV